MECEFCNKIFANQYILETHQRTAKYCLSIQGKTTTKFVCKCGRSLCSKERLTNHIKRCEKQHTKESCNKKLNLSPEYLSSQISKITCKDLSSIDKFVFFISNTILDGAYKCSDPVKLHFTYRDLDGNRMRDIGCELVYNTLRKLKIFLICFETIDKYKCEVEYDTMASVIITIASQADFAKELAKRLY